MRVAIVIPAYQAAATIGEVVQRSRLAQPAAAIVVVDDGSTDGSGAAARAAAAIRLETHPRNRGKGAALATGIAAALDEGADVVATLDADGQHPPESLPDVLGPVLAGAADICVGARRRSAPMPLARRFSNWLSVRLVMRAGAGAARPDIRDVQSGFRAFTAAVGRQIRPAERGYDFETAFLFEALARGFRVTSVPIPTLYPKRGTSHFRAVADTWRVARVFTRHARRILAGDA